MNTQIEIELIRLIPNVLWILLIAGIVAAFYKPLLNQILPRLGGLSAFGVQVTFMQQELDKVIKQQGPDVTDKERSLVLRRAQRVMAISQKAQVLWVDDMPDNNIYLRDLLRSLGIYVDLAKNTFDAVSMVALTKYDVIISDMKRDGDSKAGIKMLAEFQQRNLDAYRWTVFYFSQFDPGRGVPTYAFGATNRPDELIHLILDILERKRS